jgi:hypothetical protein
MTGRFRISHLFFANSLAMIFVACLFPVAAQLEDYDLKVLDPQSRCIQTPTSSGNGIFVLYDIVVNIQSAKLYLIGPLHKLWIVPETPTMLTNVVSWADAFGEGPNLLQELNLCFDHNALSDACRLVSVCRISVLARKRCKSTLGSTDRECCVILQILSSLRHVSWTDRLNRPAELDQRQHQLHLVPHRSRRPRQPGVLPRPAMAPHLRAARRRRAFPSRPRPQVSLSTVQAPVPLYSSI